MQVDIDTLMTWARAHAPLDPPLAPAKWLRRRRVRLEIAAEREWVACDRPEICIDHMVPRERVVARAYLASPRCINYHQYADTDEGNVPCECDPIAETRIA